MAGGRASAPRVVFLGYPARGHTAPTLPVVSELVRRGARVDYYSTPQFQPLIDPTGARFVAYPPGCERLSTPLETDEHLARSLEVAEELLPVLLPALDPPPDLVLFDASAIWGGLAARRLGIPCVASITTFALTRSMLQMLGSPGPAAWSVPIVERLNGAYDAGFRHPLDVVEPRADLKLVYTSRLFQPAGRFFDPTYLFLGPLLNRRPRDGADARGQGARPLAYVSLGTVYNRDHALLRQIADVLAAEGWEAILSLGGGSSPSLTWPDHVQAHPFVDQIGVLAQAQLFVTHGGMNSVSEALSHGVPMIVIPQAVDQHLVARQAAGLGAAVVIERSAVSPDALVAALARIQEGRAAFEAAAARLQQSFDEASPLAGAIDQALALTERPRVG